MVVACTAPPLQTSKMLKLTSEIKCILHVYYLLVLANNRKDQGLSCKNE